MAQTEKLRFGKDRRLIRSADFARVRSEGRTQRGTNFMLGVLDVGEAVPFRAGFVTSRRVGSAVTRNGVRRRLREIVRKHQHAIGTGVWLVIVAHPRAAQASYSALEDEWLRLAKRASILAP